MSWGKEFKNIIWQIIIGAYRLPEEQGEANILTKNSSLSLLLTFELDPQLWDITRDLIFRGFHLQTIRPRIRFQCCLACVDSSGTCSNLISTPLPSHTSPQNQRCLHQNHFICTYESIAASKQKTWGRLSHWHLFPSEYHRSCLSLWYKVSDYISLFKLCWNEGHSICHNQ